MPASALFVVRYSEIGLKGKNRSYFEGQLVTNLRLALARLGLERIDRIRGRILVTHAGDEPAIAARIADTPGVRSFSAARPVARDYGEIERAAVELARERLARGPVAPLPGTAGPHATEAATFGVRTERVDKTFPLRSIEVSAKVGAAILAAAPVLRVRLDDPELEVAIEIYKDRAFVMSDWQRGPGGLPVGTGGNVALLLSGGIDSPVAGFLLQKRGCMVWPVYCHAFPFTGDAAKEKVIDLARALARRQSPLELRIAPIAEAQVAMRDACRKDLLVVLYRRFMVRIAERFAPRGAALGTGENLGQVASQTLTNMCVIDGAAKLPILRPLLTYDKEETIAVARRLGTFEISIRPADDCCQLFLPRRPATHARLEDVLAEEAKLDMAALLDACAAKVEKVRFLRGEIANEEVPP